MTTLRTPRLDDFSDEERAVLERLAKRMGQPADDLRRPHIFGVQAHWPAWRRALGVDGVPAIWRALAHHPRLLDATWRKDRLVLGALVVDERVKSCAALAVAAFRQSAYWIPYLTQLLRTRCDLDTRALVKIAGAVSTMCRSIPSPTACACTVRCRT